MISTVLLTNVSPDPHGNEVLSQACTEFICGLVLSPVYINLKIKRVHFNLTLCLYWLNSQVTSLLVPRTTVLEITVLKKES